MAMQVGMGLSKILLILGAGYTGTIVLRNGRLSDILDEIQSMAKGLEKSAGENGADSEVGDALALQVRRLAMEVWQLAYARPNNYSQWIWPSREHGIFSGAAAAARAVGYGYIWWKVRRLAMEVRQLASACPITILSGSGQAGNMASFLVQLPLRGL